MELSSIDKIIDRYEGAASSLLAIMQDVQDEARYLPRDAMERVAERLGVPIARVYQMATFFDSFHLEPRGKHICTVCMGTACHVRGSVKLVEQLERDLEIKSGGTTKDMMFTIEEVNCVGACALGPLVIVDGEYNGNMTSSGIQKMVKKLRKAEGSA
jgi:NADH:ubiquinone oxidoreductase subunit E